MLIKSRKWWKNVYFVNIARTINLQKMFWKGKRTINENEKTAYAGKNVYEQPFFQWL